MLVTRTGANLHKYIDICNTDRLRGCMQFYRHAGALEAEASRGGRTHNGSGGAVRHSVLVWQFGSVTWSVCVTCWGPPLISVCVLLLCVNVLERHALKITVEINVKRKLFNCRK